MFRQVRLKMMKTLNTLLVELKRTIINPYFLACTIMVAVMCFTSPAYYDASTNSEVSIFEMLAMIGTEKAQSYEFARQMVLTRGYGSWTAQFLIILVSFPFVKVMCDERLYGQKRYFISRAGIAGYSASKLVSAVISAVLICLAGYLIFSAVVAVIFPSIDSFSQSAQESAAMMSTPYHEALIRFVIVGASFVVLPFILAAFTRNIYFCVCIPFLVQYIQRTAENKIAYDLMEKGTYDSKISLLLGLFSHDSAELIVYGEATALYAALLQIAVFAAAFAVFYAVQKRRVDNGA